MSKQIHCPECQSENTPGSKFCNHCGARLPKSTSILCPRCQTPNPHNNFYCDNCGGRLQAEQTNIPPEEAPKQKESDLPTSAKMFTLPTRDPGDTGDLDPASLPDWLKSQSNKGDAGQQEETGKLPRLSDLTPEERDTADDLPGWLINTENENLLIDSPDDITTEHFLHLIQDINEEEREKLSGLLNDPSITGDAANLPDWLKDVAKPTQKETPASSPDDIDEGADWLFESDPAENDTSQAEAKGTSTQEEASPQDPNEVPDWLSELGPPSTALLGTSNSDELASTEPEFDENEDLPDWLTGEADSTETYIDPIGSNDVFSDDALFEDDVPDWMLGDTKLEDTPQDDTPTQEESLDDLTLDAAASTSLTGWLAEFDTDDDDVEETAVSSEEPPPADKSETQRSLTDWLTAFDEEDLVPDEEPPEPTLPEEVPEDALPDWLTGIDEAVSAAKADKPAQETAPTDDDSFDWLSDDDALSETISDETKDDDVEEPLPADKSGTQRSLTDWLTPFDEESPEPTLPEEVSKDALPDWMTGTDEAVSTAKTDEPAQETASTDDDSFDWLSDYDELSENTSDKTKDESSDWLSSGETQAEPDDALADLLNLDISNDVSLTTGNTGLLPDWLDDLEPATDTSSQFDSSELDSTLEDLFGTKPKDATGELEWLEDTDDDTTESDSDDSSLVPLAGAIGAAALIDASNQDDDAPLDDNLDWLSELAAFDANDEMESVESEMDTSADPAEAISEPSFESILEDEDDFDIEAIFDATESSDLDEFEIDDELLGVNEQTSGDWADIDGILAGTTDDEALPDWLEQLDNAPELADMEVDEEPPEEIPAWVANLRPDDTGELNSVLPSALFTESDASNLLSDTDDLEDSEMPDWLGDTIDGRATPTEQDSYSWFDSTDEIEDAPAELEALLADLPPAQAPEDMLQKAEIPDWLEELKPRELTGKTAPIIESRMESSGPLAGMPNTIGIEPIIAMPRAASMPGSYTISPEQAQQALLLRQLVQEEPQPPQAGATTLSARGLAGLRILVALLLLASIVLGLYGPAFLKSKTPTTVPVPAAAMNTAVSNAAGQTVLIAFEYTPALAGDLDHEAETLLTQLNAIGSPILTTSQYVAGTGIARAVTAPYDVASLGLIPGEAMGLRQLGDCLGENALVSTCTSLHNRSLSNEMSDMLADVGLIIVLTGDRSSLVNWVEQVGTSSDVPIVVGTTQALEPMVVPYYASAQVKGYLNGLPDTVAYQQAYVQMVDSPAETQYGALSLVYLVTAVILLIGGLIFGFKKKKS